MQRRANTGVRRSKRRVLRYRSGQKRRGSSKGGCRSVAVGDRVRGVVRSELRLLLLWREYQRRRRHHVR